MGSWHISKILANVLLLESYIDLLVDYPNLIQYNIIKGADRNRFRLYYKHLQL